MQHISVLNSTQSQDFTWTGRQNDVHAGRLFCWSGALVTLSIWVAMQFFHGQNHRWNRQHPHTNPTRITTELSLPPTPEGLAIMRRAHEHRYQRASLAKLPPAP